MKTPDVEANRPEVPGRGSGAQPPRLADFDITPTGDEGIHTGRPRYRVLCKLCSVVVHPNTTGPAAWAAGHQRERHTAPVAPLPGEVGLAFAAWTDSCNRCGRPINVNEPIYRDSFNRIRCAACNDAVPVERERPRRIEDWHPGDLITSVLMRRAAQFLSGAVEQAQWNGNELRTIAHELRLRAEMLQERADGWRWSTTNGVPNADIGMVLRAIGEVRS